MKFNVLKRLKDAGRKAYKAVTGKDMPTTPYYGRITPPTMIDRPLFTPKAAPPPPPKKKKRGLLDSISDGLRSTGRAIDRAVTQPIVNQVKQAGKAIDKKVIQPVSTSKTMKSIQKAAQKGADSAGDVIQGRKDIYGNDINRQAKSKVEETTPLVDDGSAQQKAAREMEAEIARGKMMSEATRRNQGMIDGRIDAGFEGDIAAGRARPMVNSETENKIANTIIDGLSRVLPGKATASTGSNTSLPQEGVLVADAGNSGWQAYPNKQNKTPDRKAHV